LSRIFDAHLEFLKPERKQLVHVSAATLARTQVRARLARVKSLVAGALLVLLMPFLAAAQASVPTPRIATQIDEANRTTLRGNTHPLARPQYDQGAVAGSQPIRRMLLLLQRSPEQETALKQFMDQQQSKSSPNFHRWLTPKEFGEQFGPADADIQTVTNWLQSHGFQVANVSNGHTLIEFSGTAVQVRDAFRTDIHKYVVDGKLHFANSSDPQIPTTLAPVVAGLVSLHNFPRKAQSHVVGAFRKTKANGQVSPLFTFGGPGTNCGAMNCNAVGPGDFATIYSVERLWNPGINTHPIDGTGQTIAIVGDSEICTKNSPDFGTAYIGPSGSSVTCSVDDVAQFRALFGLPANNPNVILDGPDPGFNQDEIEGNLDVQLAGAVAKNSTIDYVIAEGTEASFGTDLAAEYVVDNNLAPVLNESFGECEFNLGANGNQFEATLWQQAAAQGITVIVSAGDNGSAGCDDPNTETAAGQNGVNFGSGVNGIASTPFNVAVGGTDFDITAANYQSTYWGAGNVSDINGVKDISALSYIPETTWNDSCAQNFMGALTGCSSLTKEGIVASGGGQSNCIATNAAGNCNTYYAKPAWQFLASGSGLTAVNDLTRDLPDVSLFGADGFVSNSFYVVCESDLNPGGPACDTNGPYFDFTGVGGTSSASPAFAGMMALVNHNIAINHLTLSARQGNANYVLYNLASTQSTSNCNSSTGPASTCNFYDITKGNNSVPCVGGSFGCSSSAPGTFGIEEAMDFVTGNLAGFPAWDAATGLDLATGLGSVNATNLVTNWATAEGLFTPTTPTLCLSLIQTSTFSCPGPITIPHGTKVYVNIAVNANGNPIPVTESSTRAEDVSLVGTFPAGNPSCSAPGCFTGGVDRFTLNNSVVSNADIYALTSGSVSNATTTDLVGGTYNVAAHYAGDGTYGASDSSPGISVTVTPETSTTQVSVGINNLITGKAAGATSAYYGDSIVVRADVIGAISGQQSATGTVTLLDGGNNLGAFALNTEGYAEDQTGAMVSGAPTPALAVGAHSFTASFTGDLSYKASNTSAPVTLMVLQAPTTISVTPSLTTVPTNTPVTLTAVVDTQSSSNLSSGGSSGAAPSGTVTFFNNGVSIGTASGNQLVSAPDANGFVAAHAQLTVTLAANAIITAAYPGDTNYTTSTSTGVTITVGTPGINLSPASNTATITIASPGQSAMQLITVTAGNSFTGSVTLSCAVSSEPMNAVNLPSCSFGPPDQNFTGPQTITLTSTATSGNATMTVTSTAAHASLFRFIPPDHTFAYGWPVAAGAMFLFCLCFRFVTSGQRRWHLASLAFLLFVVVAAGAGCSSTNSGGGGTGGGNPGTTTGTYTITVTATPSTGTAQTTAIGVNVQ
jgi:hypothetical protein